MAELILLGTSNAIPDEYHDNTHMALAGKDRLVLIDCVNNELLRFKKSGLQVHALTDILLTHFHPDHVNGLPALLMNLWLLGRRRSLTLHGLAPTMRKARAMMELFEWQSWPQLYPVSFTDLPPQELAVVLECPEFRILSSPVCHLIPNIGLRMESLESGRVIAYSCDTAPCPQVVQLAQGADVLIHEASGAYEGHSTPRQAGEIATQAGAKELILIHYPTGQEEQEEWLRQAQTSFSGTVQLAYDYQRLPL